MKRWEKWSFHILVLLITGTGVAYFCFRYLMEKNDPFQVINHPLEPLALSLHILAAPLLIFLLGWTYRSHVRGKLQNGERTSRRSGLLALILFPLMVASGYALQILSHPLLLQAMFVLHLATSALFAVNYLVHQVIHLRRARKPSRSRRGIRSYGLARWLGRAA